MYIDRPPKEEVQKPVAPPLEPPPDMFLLPWKDLLAWRPNLLAWKPNLSDVLAALIFVAMAGGFAYVAVHDRNYGNRLTWPQFARIVVLVPAAEGAAIGSLAHGWRRCGKLSRLALITSAGFFAVWSFLLSCT